MLAFEKKRFENIKNEFTNKQRSWLKRVKQREEREAERKAFQAEEEKQKLERVKFVFSKEVALCERLME